MILNCTDEQIDELVEFAFKQNNIIEHSSQICYKSKSGIRINGDRSGTVEIIAVSENFRRKGYGRSIISYLIDIAFNFIKVDKIDLIVDGDNEKAIKLYLDLGFVIESKNRCYIV